MHNNIELRKKFECLGLSEEKVDFYMESELDLRDNPTLAPLVMFKEIWDAAVKKGDNEWIQSAIEHFEMRKDLVGVAAAKWPEDDDYLNALKAVVDSGIDLEHITNIVCRIQEHLLYQVAYVLSNSSVDEPMLSDINWAVFQTDEDGQPIREMNMLNELYHAVAPYEMED